MPVLKAPPKLIRNATIQVRVEEEVDIKLKKYAAFIHATPSFVVAESLKLVFNKDAEFREWLAQHGDNIANLHAEKPNTQEPVPTKPSVRTMLLEDPADPEILLNDRFGQIPAFGRFREEFGTLARVHPCHLVHALFSAICLAIS